MSLSQALSEVSLSSTASIPNLFLIGAPKCGTSALSQYLGEHPDIFMSTPKEPNFFNTQFSPKYRTVTEAGKYLNDCFYGAKDSEVVGEATVWYLYDEEAIPQILAFQPQARFIAMVRNPIDLAHALHATELFTGHEDIEDFEAAWRLQAERRAGKHIPPGCSEPEVLQYGAIAQLGKQVQRFFQRVPSDQRHVIVFEDFTGNTKLAYEEVLQFLNVPGDNRDHFPVYNANRKYRNQQFSKLIHQLGRKTNIGPLKRKLGIPPSMSITRWLKQLNTKQDKRETLSTSFIEELKQYFREDIALLSELLDRDLTHWTK